MHSVRVPLNFNGTMGQYESGCKLHYHIIFNVIKYKAFDANDFGARRVLEPDKT